MTKKKAYMVMSRNPGVLDTGLKTGKGKLKFKNGKNAMFVGDAALANEIDTVHGLKGSGDVWVHEDPRSEPFLRDDGAIGAGVHRYFWGPSSRFSNAWEEFEKRRKDKNEKRNEQTEATETVEDQGIEEGQDSTSNRTKRNVETRRRRKGAEVNDGSDIE